MKRILITGARSGIISKVIDNIINEYYIYITVHTTSELKAIQKKYKNYKNINCFKLDINSKKDRNLLLNLNVDILISNAAIGESGSISEIQMTKLRENFETNVFSTIEIVQIVLKNMIKKGSGRIIIISSLAGIIPIPFLGAYCATKASLIKMAETLNLELKLLPYNIDVCLIEPGFYKTGFNELMFDKKYEWMDIDSYFKLQIERIKATENIMLSLLEKQKLNSIVKRITKAIKKERIRFVYRAPFSQALFAKIYNLLN